MQVSNKTQRRIKVDKEKCMSCFNCMFACMAEHNDKGESIYDLDLEDPRSESRTHVASDEYGNTISVICRHCDEPECVNTCMSGAMQKNEETGEVTYDKDRCASCYMCIMACPFGSLKPDRVDKKVIMKCDMCPDRETPRCVEFCPTGAITVEVVER